MVVVPPAAVLVPRPEVDAVQGLRGEREECFAQRVVVANVSYEFVHEYYNTGKVAPGQ
jgi:hypothetical protein